MPTAISISPTRGGRNTLIRLRRTPIATGGSACFMSMIGSGLLHVFTARSRQGSYSSASTGFDAGMASSGGIFRAVFRIATAMARSFAGLEHAPTSTISSRPWPRCAKARQSQREIAESLRLQGHLLASVRQAIITTDTQSRITSWNRHAEVIYGWTAEEAIGRDIATLMFPEGKCEDAGEEAALALKADSRVDREGRFARRTARSSGCQ